MQAQSTNSPVSIGAVSLRYGVLLVLGWLLIDFGIRQIGLSFFSYIAATTAASLVSSTVVTVLAHRAFRQAHGGLLRYGQGVIITLAIMLLWGLGSALFNYVYVHYIDPDFVDNLRDGLVAFMERSRVPAAKIEESTARFEEMKGPFGKALLSGLTSGLAYGIILGLIVSIFTKRNPSEFE